MHMGCVSYLRVAPRDIAMRSVQGRLYQRGHALIMKTAMDNVTLGFWYCAFHGAGEPIVSLLSFFIYCSPTLDGSPPYCLTLQCDRIAKIGWAVSLTR